MPFLNSTFDLEDRFDLQACRSQDEIGGITKKGFERMQAHLRIAGEHRRFPNIVAGLVVAVALHAAPAISSELVYKPINPNFGGNPFNDGILLGTANAQNKYEREREERDPTEQFARSLQSRLFSGLARQVEDAIFGDDPQDNGVFTVGAQQVSFERGLEFITIEISNLDDGGVTVVQVPVIDLDEGPQ
ncbi:MAG: curli assembly protein CsgF [Geminicoccaceae bacterium]